MGCQAGCQDLSGHLGAARRDWSSTLSARVRLVISRLVLIFVLHLDFHERVRVVRTMFLPCALHGVEASYLSKGSFLKLRAAVMRAVWSRRQPFGAFWMDLMVVTLPCVWFVSGLGFFVGTCLLGLRKWPRVCRLL